MNSFDNTAAAGGPAGGPQHNGSTYTPAAPESTPQRPPTAPPRPPAPGWLLGARRWLLWREERDAKRPDAKPKKVPYYVSGGRRGEDIGLDTPEDVAKLATIQEASEAFLKLKPAYAGLGFALGPDGAGGCWQGIDLDDVLDHGRGELAGALPGYVETSPSQSGVHAIGYGEAFDSLFSNGSGIEAYAAARFFTWTGRSFDPDAPLVDLSAFVRLRLVPIHSSKRAPGQAGSGASPSGASLGGGDGGTYAPLTPQQISEVRSALNFIRADDEGVWMEVFYSLKPYGDTGRELWFTWSQTSVAKWDPLEAADRWDNRKCRGDKSIASIFHMAQERGWLNPASKAAQIAEPEPTAEEVEALRAKIDAELPPLAFDLTDFRPPQMTLRDMLAELVFVTDGEYVAFRNNPRIRTTTKAMGAMLLSNKTTVPAKEPGKKDEEVRTFNLWLASPMRETAFTFGFDPNRGRLFEDNRVRYLNLWRPPVHTLPQDWQARVKPFVAHVHYLLPVPAEAERFLDFLAHIQQRPGELPHAGWLLISKLEGTGRGLLFRWLDKVWPGYVQQSLELSRVLTDNFTDELSQKLLLVVDEIDEGSQGAMWKLRPALKRFMTSPVRHMNPKTFRRYTERNVARMAICSNELTALPIDPRDRRLWVSHNASEPGPAWYYTELGELEKDAAFIASVWHYLRTRDLSAYNPHERPVMNEAKRKVIENTKARDEELAEDVAKTWPRDIITGTELSHALYGPEPTPAEKGRLKYRANEIGAVRWADNGSGIVRLHGRGGPRDTVWILRNHDAWIAAPLHDVQRELARPGA